MDEVNVIVRDFYPSQDEAYIYASWRNSAYYSAATKPKGTPINYFKKKTQEIRNILKSAQVRIACHEDAPIVIVGYAVMTGTHLEWVYVKDQYRKKGIGALLIPKNIETVTNQLTKIGAVLIQKKNLKTKGEIEDGRDNNTHRQAN